LSINFEGTAAPETNNLRGKLYHGYDGAGIETIPSYDFEGNPNSVIRQYVSDPTQHPDWSPLFESPVSSPAMETETYNTSMTYDALGRPVTITSPDDGITTYAYEESGMLYSIVVNSVHGLSTDIVNEIYYDAKVQRLKVKFENGATTTYNYDPFTFRVTEIRTTRSSDSNILQDLLYWYDPVGNITIQEDTASENVYFNGSVASPDNNYTYDALYRLIIAEGREYGVTGAPTFDDSARRSLIIPTNGSAMVSYTEYYAYDEVGNMTQQKHTTTGATNNWTRNFTIDTGTNEVVGNSIGSKATSAESYGYDGRGNLIVGLNNLYVSEDGYSMVYNDNNCLETVLLTDSMTAYYQYDNTGQRVRKTIVNIGANLSETRKYLGQWELYQKVDTGLDSVILERETLNIMDDQARVALIDTPTILPSGSDETQLLRYQFSNHLRTATLELDYQAAIISYEEYYPYGSTSFQSGRTEAEVSLKRYRYVGKERDEETGLYYIGARYYCSWSARWCAVDPLESKYSPQSPYCYCSDNPIGRVDLDGMGDKIAGAWDPVRTEDAPTRPAADVVIETGKNQNPVSPDSPIAGGINISTKQKTHHVHAKTHHKINIGIEPVGAMSAIDKDIKAFRDAQAKKDAQPKTAQIGSQIIDLS